jgi:hypothetical protein
MGIALAILLIATELVHSAWLVRIPLGGQVADPVLPLIIAIAFRRPEWGPLAGLGAGLLQDLLFGGSLGLFAFPKLLVGQGAAVLGRILLIDQPLLPWVVTAAATVVHQIVLAIVLLVTDLLPVTAADFGRLLLLQEAANLLAVWPAFALVRAAAYLGRRPRRWLEGLHGV